MYRKSISAMSILAGVVLFWGLLVLCSCGKRETPQTPPAPSTKETPAAPVAVTTLQTTCPVEGAKIDKSVYADYEGKRVYFCCTDCKAKFNADPAKYVKQLEDKGITLEKAPQ